MTQTPLFSNFICVVRDRQRNMVGKKTSRHTQRHFQLRLVIHIWLVALCYKLVDGSADQNNDSYFASEPYLLPHTCKIRQTHLCTLTWSHNLVGKKIVPFYRGFVFSFILAHTLHTQERSAHRRRAILSLIINQKSRANLL